MGRINGTLENKGRRLMEQPKKKKKKDTTLGQDINLLKTVFVMMATTLHDHALVNDIWLDMVREKLKLVGKYHFKIDYDTMCEEVANDKTETKAF